MKFSDDLIDPVIENVLNLVEKEDINKNNDFLMKRDDDSIDDYCIVAGALYYIIKRDYPVDYVRVLLGFFSGDLGIAINGYTAL